MSKLYLGVDIAKETHFATMTNQQGEILLPPFPFTNDNAGFNEFLEKIKPFISENECTIGFESTAHYASNFLDDNQLPFVLINPLVTSSLSL